MITNTKEAMINRDSQSEAISRGAKPIGVSETNNGHSLLQVLSVSLKLEVLNRLKQI